MYQYSGIVGSPMRESMKRSRVPRDRKQFVPTTRQIIAATKLIRSTLASGAYVPGDLVRAAARLTKLLGKTASCLGNIATKRVITITAGLEQLLEDEAVAVIRKRYVLAA